MTIDRAIIILKHPQFPGPLYSDKEYAEALKLGIEALKEVKRIRSHKDFDATIYLPGETKN